MYHFLLDSDGNYQVKDLIGGEIQYHANALKSEQEVMHGQLRNNECHDD